MTGDQVDMAESGARNTRIFAACCLCSQYGVRHFAVISPRSPPRPAQTWSGVIHRNWWPHSWMTKFRNHNIILLEDSARVTGRMTRQGHVLANPRHQPSGLLHGLGRGHGTGNGRQLRFRGGCGSHGSCRNLRSPGNLDRQRACSWVCAKACPQPMQQLAGHGWDHCRGQPQPALRRTVEQR